MTCPECEKLGAKTMGLNEMMRGRRGERVGKKINRTPLCSYHWWIILKQDGTWSYDDYESGYQGYIKYLKNIREDGSIYDKKYSKHFSVELRRLPKTIPPPEIIGWDIL